MDRLTDGLSRIDQLTDADGFVEIHDLVNTIDGLIETERSRHYESFS